MSNLSDFSTNEGLDFFLQSSLNSKVESFVFDTIEYFEKPRKGTRFNKLNFLPLLHKQIENIENNLSKPYSNVQKILSLPLNDLEKHILFGFILKKYGGYPITVDPYQKISIVLKLIETEFLKLDEETPEKKYCLRLDSQSFTPPQNDSKPERYKFTNKDVKAYSYSYDWDYYLGMDIIVNIELVLETISYFEKGNRKGLVEPLTALNFIHYQKTYLNENCSKPFENLAYFKSLGIDEELRHVLYFFLVKWNGGSFYNDNQDYKRNYHLIKKELQKYDGETPEKIELGLSKTVENDTELIPLIEELSRIESVTSKFDYWVSVKEKFEGYYPQILTLNIPLQLYEKYFKPLVDDLEFLNCLLKYEANSWFESIKSVENLEAKVKSSFSQTFIKEELEKIELFATESYNCLKDDIFRNKIYYDHGQKPFLEYLRLKEDYYQKDYKEKNKALSEYYPLTFNEVQQNSDVVMVYAKYYLKKDYLEKHLLNEEVLDEPQVINSANPETKSFESFFIVENPKEFVEELKRTFKIEKSKKIRILIDTLVEREILIKGERDMKLFLESMTSFFQRDIGSYQSINDFKYKESHHEKDKSEIISKLESLKVP